MFKGFFFYFILSVIETESENPTEHWIYALNIEQWTVNSLIMWKANCRRLFKFVPIYIKSLFQCEYRISCAWWFLCVKILNCNVFFEVWILICKLDNANGWNIVIICINENWCICIHYVNFQNILFFFSKSWPDLEQNWSILNYYFFFESRKKITQNIRQFFFFSWTKMKLKIIFSSISSTKE